MTLVRAPDDAQARARLVAALAVSGPDAVARFEELANDRLTVLAGDLTHARFGLTEETYGALADQVEGVIHNGALVNHALGYRQLYEPNVLGTVEALRFALRRRLKPVKFISSIAVAAGARRPAPISEDEDAAKLWPTRPAQFDRIVGGGYTSTKWAGEILTQQFAALTGASVAIFRVGSLLAHSSWPKQINDADAHTRLFAGLVATGLAPRSFFAPHYKGPRALEGTPVDRAASAITALALDDDARGIFHVTRRARPGALDLDEVVAILERAGRIRQRVDSYSEWLTGFRRALLQLDKDAQRRSALPLLGRWAQPIAGALQLDTTRFDEAVARLTDDKELPALTEGDVLRWLADLGPAVT